MKGDFYDAIGALYWLTIIGSVAFLGWNAVTAIKGRIIRNAYKRKH